MRGRTVNDIQGLITTVQRLPLKGEDWIFRGQPDRSYKLIPKAGRPPFYEIDDLDFFDEWRRKAVAYIQSLPSDEWEALAIAQHHGLATRLLDWTFNYSVAAYFAATSHFQGDGAVYCYYPQKFDIAPRPTLRALTSVCMYSPPMSVPRIVSQQGVFTCHPKPVEPLDDPHIFTIIIPAEAKPTLLVDLDALGLNEAALFPDLDGLSRHMNWKATLRRPELKSLDLARLFQDPRFRKKPKVGAEQIKEFLQASHEDHEHTEHPELGADEIKELLRRIQRPGN
jgi:hypothetical protein